MGDEATMLPMESRITVEACSVSWEVWPREALMEAAEAADIPGTVPWPEWPPCGFECEW
jgi:hypothetical protein